jgi:hypothetical protein
VQALTGNKSDDAKDGVYKELQPIFEQFLKCHMKILLEDFDAKLGREYRVKSTVGSESLHKISNNNGVTVINFPT